MVFDSNDLPQSLLEAAQNMKVAFVAGTDAEADAAAIALEKELNQLPITLAEIAQDYLADIAASSLSERTAYVMRQRLGTATLTATRPLPNDLEVRTFKTPQGEEFAVVVPSGKDTVSSLRREALLAGACPKCQGLLNEKLVIEHQTSCLAFV